MDGFKFLYFFATLSTWDLHFLPPCIPVSAWVWLYGTAVAEEPPLQWRSLRSCYLSIPGHISRMDFCYFSINGCFIPYFHVLNHEQNQILAKGQKNRAKGRLKCVPKTIMGPEDCAAPHVSFLRKSVRAQVRLWNIHSLSLSDFSCTEDLLQNWQLCWNLLCSSPEPLSWPPLPLLCSNLVYLQ